jgi:hypothetical protein
MKKTFYKTFKEYIADNPKGERFRKWFTNIHTKVSFFLTNNVNETPLPGGYFWGVLTTDGINGPPKIWINDIDDTAVERVCADITEAKTLFENLHNLAPFSMKDLVDNFNFKWV